MKKEEHNFNKIAKYLTGNSTPEEREALFARIREEKQNREAFEEGMEVWEIAGEIPKEDWQPDVEAAWQKMETRFQKYHSGEVGQDEGAAGAVRRRLIPAWMFAAAAAVLLTILWVGGVFSDFSVLEVLKTKTVITEKTMVELPDGSNVWLNNNSKLEFFQEFSDRSVRLEGEAFFEVARDESRPFRITAGKTTTTVLGTSFNVRAYPDEEQVEVAVKTGKVKVELTNNQSEPVILNPGKLAMVENDQEQIIEQSFSIANMDAWRNSQLNFQDVQVREVIWLLERYYNIEISIKNPAILNCIWNNTTVYKDPKLEELLETLDVVMGQALNIKQESTGSYVFSGSGCQ